MSGVAALLALLCTALWAAVPGGAGAASGHRSAHARRAHPIAGLAPDTTRRAFVRDFRGARIASGQLQYFGGPVLHRNRTHLIFWAPSGSGFSYESGYEALVKRFLSAVAADSHSPGNVYGLSGQYGDKRGAAAYSSTYGGASETTDPLPPNGCTEPAHTGPGWSVCLTDAQIQVELEHVVAAQHLPVSGTDVYFLVLPDGFGDCTDAGSTSCALGGGATGYCGYHSEANNGLLYAVIPYNAVPGHCQSDNPRPNGSAADPSLSSLSHEHNEIVTDPDAYDGWITSDGQENGDLCITQFGPNVGGSGGAAWNEVIGGGHWFLQEEWSNDDGGCTARDETNRLSARVPAGGIVARAVGMSARASDPDGSIAGYRWYFGDGTTTTGRAVRHVYRRPGRYRVVVRAVDSSQNWALRAAAVVVRRR